jgi:hypothetical protein
VNEFPTNRTRLPILACDWILIGVLMPVTGRQRVEATFAAFLDPQSGPALTAPEDRP